MYFARLFTVLSAVATVASVSASKKVSIDDDVLRNLIEKVESLESESAALKSEIATLKSNARASEPKEIKNLRRALQDELGGVKDQLSSGLLYSIFETLAAVHSCLGYDKHDDICYFGGPTVDEVYIQAQDIAYMGLGNGHPDNEEGIRMTSAEGGQVRIFSDDGRIDLDAGTNVEIKADLNQGDAVDGFAWIGTFPGDGDSTIGAYFRAYGGSDQSALINAQGRIDIDRKAGGPSNVEVDCGGMTYNLCDLP